MTPRSPWKNRQSSLRRRLPFLVCAPLALVLALTRPNLRDAIAPVDANTAGCLDNLRQIGRAYALYARDWDGKLPRGVDPEDRVNPQIWANNGEDDFSDEARVVPYLHEILQPYVASPATFHCPADRGWSRTHFGNTLNSQLRDVYPSSFAKFGTSYYCLTRYAFNQMNASDIEEPARTLLVFDGDLWHSSSGRNMINGLFADGHAQNLTQAQFNFFVRTQ